MGTTTSDQHRHFARISFDANTMVSQGPNAWPVELLDISLNGVLFKQPEDWAIHPGKPLQVDIKLADRTRIKMGVELVHITRHEAGCHCLHIDLDSITLLKRLVELNLGSGAPLERELSALIDDHMKAAS